MPTLAIVGDIHHQFTARDITYFNQSAYDLILFTGDLGEFNKGDMVKSFDQAVFNGELYKVLGPVKTQFGYHLIKVIDRSN